MTAYKSNPGVHQDPEVSKEQAFSLMKLGYNQWHTFNRQSSLINFKTKETLQSTFNSQTQWVGQD